VLGSVLAGLPLTSTPIGRTSINGEGSDSRAMPTRKLVSLSLVLGIDSGIQRV
jgi:hypothetical protein